MSPENVLTVARKLLLKLYSQGRKQWNGRATRLARVGDALAWSYDSSDRVTANWPGGTLRGNEPPSRSARFHALASRSVAVYGTLVVLASHMPRSARLVVRVA